MKTRHYILIALGMLTAVFLAVVAGMIIGKGGTAQIGRSDGETIERKVETIDYRAPKPQGELVLGTQRYTLPVYGLARGWSRGEPLPQSNKDNIRKDTLDADSTKSAHYGSVAGVEPVFSGDSAIVELPVVQRHYADSTYEAWISGPVDPRLDSLKVFAPTTIITQRVWKPPKRWHIGVSVGYGYGAKGLQPYIGVGITYSIISF